ncbi:MAG: hypothetical protein Q8N31_20025 [Reyranella sp.]|nr:hypothetical protein [Reyranella sp.]MDP3162307.1 hypothetical protein [Reyranella sp.]
MSACQEVRTWITSTILVPVERLITESREFCQEIGQWVEEEITRPVERWIEKVEKVCRDLPWPLSWLCDLVTVVVKIVEWVVETVLKWVVTIVCQVVAFVVGIVVEFVLKVVGWLVSFVVCLFSDFWSALKSIYDLWMIIVDAIADIFDFIGVLFDDIVGILDDFERLLDSLAETLGWLGVVLGLVKGIVGFVRRLVELVRDIVAGIGDLIEGILSLNLCKILRALADVGMGIVRAVLELLLPALGWLIGGLPGLLIGLGIKLLGAMIAGVRDTVVLKQGEDIIRDKINAAFGAGSERANRSIDKLHLNTRIAGLPFQADARRMFLSSRSRELDLRDLHNRGVVDLYALAGYISSCKDGFNETDGEVVYAGTETRVAIVDIDAFLADGPDAVAEFHVFPMTRAKFRMHLEVARKKARFLGIQVNYKSIGSFRATTADWIPLASTEQDGTVQRELLRTVFGRQGNGQDNLSVLPSVAHFHYIKLISSAGADPREHFGLTSWFRPSSGSRGPSGVTYRTRSPEWVLRWVLIHEMGHYWGVNHNAGVRALDEIMYTPADGVAVSASAAFEYLALGGEARFTLGDVGDAWTWITGDGADSLLP